MRPLIIVCGCGKVRRFGKWINPTPGQLLAINSGTYKKQVQNCPSCQQEARNIKQIPPVIKGVAS